MDCNGGWYCPGAHFRNGACATRVGSGVDWNAVLGRNLPRRGSQEASGGVLSPVGGYSHVSVCVDVCHLCRFGCPVDWVILDYAEGVDPDVFDVEGSRNGKGVGKGLWEWLGEGDEAIAQIGNESTDGLFSAPAMNQGCEAACLARHRQVKPGFRVGVADMDQPLGKASWARYATAHMLAFGCRAFVEPLSHQRYTCFRQALPRDVTSTADCWPGRGGVLCA